jgi:hypothetical protein
MPCAIADQKGFELVINTETAGRLQLDVLDSIGGRKVDEKFKP